MFSDEHPANRFLFPQELISAILQLIKETFMATNNKDTMDEGHVHEHCDCMHHGYMGHYGLRWILAIIILLMVFCLGMKLGEFKGFVEANYGFGGHDNMMFRTDGPAGMMKFWSAPVGGTTGTTTITPGTTTTK